MQSKITYLGRQISLEEILPDKSGVTTVKNLKPPKDANQLEAFFGKDNYYHNFIPNYSNIAAPINKLHRKDVPSRWGKEQQKPFDDLKSYIANATQLAHYQDDLFLLPMLRHSVSALLYLTHFQMKPKVLSHSLQRHLTKRGQTTTKLRSRVLK